MEAGEWQLAIYCKMKCSKSEGQHGELCHASSEVVAGATAQVVSTPLGELRCIGALMPETPSFQHTGWNFPNPDRIRALWEGR